MCYKTGKMVKKFLTINQGSQDEVLGGNNALPERAKPLYGEAPAPIDHTQRMPDAKKLDVTPKAVPDQGTGLGS